MTTEYPTLDQAWIDKTTALLNSESFVSKATKMIKTHQSKGAFGLYKKQLLLAKDLIQKKYKSASESEQRASDEILFSLDNELKIVESVKW
jgi:hypothetical protein